MKIGLFSAKKYAVNRFLILQIGERCRSSLAMGTLLLSLLMAGAATPADDQAATGGRAVAVAQARIIRAERIDANLVDRVAGGFTDESGDNFQLDRRMTLTSQPASIDGTAAQTQIIEFY